MTEESNATDIREIDIRDEVLKEIGEHGDRYVAFLEKVIGCLDTYKVKPEGNFIRNIYSRKSKQGGRELKATDKIAKKLIREQNRLNKDVRVTDLPDIVGLTVVCFYRWEFSKVENYLSQISSSNGFTVGPVEEKKELGYYAIHLILESTTAEHMGLKCEVQLKTMLHDSWGAKTHDLTYKPMGPIDVRHKKIMQSIGDQLESIETQSELLYNLIQERANVDVEHRTQARRTLAANLLNANYFKDKLNEPQLQLKKEIDSDMDLFESCDGDNPTLSRLLTKLLDAVKPEVREIDCFLLSYLACIRMSRDIDYLVDRTIRRRIKHCNREELLRAHMLEQLTLFCTDRFEEAARASISALRDLSKREPEKSLLPMRFNALSYACYHLLTSASPNQEIRKEAVRQRTNLDAMIEELNDDFRGAARDTLGLARIALGDNEEEIQEGIRICGEAKATAPSQELADTFFNWNQRLAWFRILNLHSENR